MVKLQLIQSRLNFSQMNELQMYPRKNLMLCYQLKFSKKFLHFLHYFALVCSKQVSSLQRRTF